MKPKHTVIAAIIAMLLSLCLATSVSAQPASPLTDGGKGKPAQLVADSSFCDTADNAATLGACVSGLTNDFRTTAGLTPNPGYSYVTTPGGTLFPPCAYASVIALYCDGNVRLGQQTLSDIYTLGINPQAYGTFLASHEATHHSQTVVGGANLTLIFLLPWVKPYELQADCIGGLTIGHYVAQGRFFYEDALGIMSVFDRAPTSSTHGSSADRKNAFWAGYGATSVSACMGGKFASRPLVS